MLIRVFTPASRGASCNYAIGVKGDITLVASYKEEGLYVKLTSFEKNPKVTGTEYGHKVHLDSCLEFFVSMDNQSPLYVNFEANAAGAAGYVTGEIVK